MAVHSQLQLQQLQMAAALGGGNQVPKLFQKVMVPAPMFSEPESELTCNQSGSRKRARDEPHLPMPPSSSALYQQQDQQLLLQKQRQLLLLKQAAASGDLRVDRSRLLQSTTVSTSGRPPLMATAAAAEPTPVSPGYNNTEPGGSSSSSLMSMLHYHSLEVDALILLHEEKLRSGLDEARKRQCRAVVAAMEQQVRRRVAEKQAELDAAAQMNAELEERLRQAATESQAWFDVARNSEALVAGLRASLEQALLRKLGDGNNNRSNGNYAADAETIPFAVAEEEGYGDSEEEAASAAFCSSVQCAEASSSLVGTARDKPFEANGGCLFPCKTCGEPDASVVLLPCRHLCLCPSCEPSVDRCPVCSGRKSGSFQINLS